MAIKYTVMDFKDVKEYEKFSAIGEDHDYAYYAYMKLPQYYWTKENGEITPKKKFNACILNKRYVKDNDNYRQFDDTLECYVYGERN